MTDIMTSQNIDLSSWDTLYTYYYSRIPLVQHPQNWTGAGLAESKILMYHKYETVRVGAHT